MASHLPHRVQVAFSLKWMNKSERGFAEPVPNNQTNSKALLESQVIFLGHGQGAVYQAHSVTAVGWTWRSVAQNLQHRSNNINLRCAGITQPAPKSRSTKAFLQSQGCSRCQSSQSGIGPRVNVAEGQTGEQPVLFAQLEPMGKTLARDDVALVALDDALRPSGSSGSQKDICGILRSGLVSPGEYVSR